MNEEFVFQFENIINTKVINSVCHLLQVHLSHKSTIKIPRIFENSTSEMTALTVIIHRIYS